MSYMFRLARAFTADISAWDVSNVTDMRAMFYSADSFNADLSAWDVSNVTDMSYMFYTANSFNADLSAWDVSNVTDMSYMFRLARAFTADISAWDVSNVTDMRSMFYSADSFNADLSQWCVSNISSEPADFATGSPLTNANKPIWGTCPGTPDQVVLGNPSDSAVDISLTPSMKWQSDTVVTTYQLQIIEGGSDPVVIDTMVIDTTFSVSAPLKRGTQYNWRVRGINESKSLTGDWSEIWSFTTIVEAPSITTLLTPVNNSSVNTLLPEFSWNQADRADQYSFQLSSEQNFSSITLDSTLTSTTFVPTNKLANGTDYFWRVKASNEVGASDWSDVFTFNIGTTVSNELGEAPVEFTLDQNYPNPFNPSTQIRYGIPKAADVQLTVFNMLGQKVATLVDGKQSAGWHTASFNASGLSSGAYIYRIQAGEFTSTKKLTLIK